MQVYEATNRLASNLVIDVINDEVTNYANVSLVDDPLIGFLWNYERDEFKAFDEVIASSTGLGSYTKNPIKLDLDLKNLMDQSGCKKQVVHHLSCLEGNHEKHGEIDIDEAFPDELVISISRKLNRGVTSWIASKCDLILLLFDPHKLDISDDFKGVIASLRGHDDKIQIAECLQNYLEFSAPLIHLMQVFFHLSRMMVHVLELLTAGSTHADILLHEEHSNLEGVSIEELHRLSIEICRLYELDTISSNILRTAGVHHWKYGRKGSSIFWLQQAQDEFRLNRIAKHLFDFFGKSASDEGIKVMLLECVPYYFFSPKGIHSLDCWFAIEWSTSDSDKEKLQERLAEISGGVTEMHV
ncbi:hypothetical protein BC332_18573 [Capsicum chinense]|nr:hypothetical protein BC332_18573 [Capsicum chinense]